MALVSDIEIRLRADIARLHQDMTRARQSVTSAVDGIKKSLIGLAAGFSLVELARQVINAQREFDKLNASLTTVTGSAAGAKEAFAAIQAFAARTPYSVQEVTEAFLKLRNLGLTPSERALASYGNTASAMGKNLNQLIEAVADAATGEFERLKEFGIKSKQQGDQVAFTFQGTTTKVANSAEAIEAYLMAIGEVQFAGGMQRQADTLDGAISALGESWNQTLIAFSQSGFGDVVRGGVMALTESLGDLAAMFKVVGGAAQNEGETVKKIDPIHSLLTTIFEALTVTGVNVAYVFKTIGKDIGAFAAQAVTLFNNGFSGLVDGSTIKQVQEIGRARAAEAEQERAEVDKTSEAILGAAAARAKAIEEEQKNRGKNTEDALAKYKIQSKASKELSDAERKEAEKRAKAYRDLIRTLEESRDASAREAAGLAPLNAAEKAAADLTRDLADGKLKLTKNQEARARSLIEENRQNLASVASQEALKKSNEALDEIEKEVAKSRKDVIDKAREEAEANEKLVNTFGMTEAAIAALEVARLKEQLAQRASVGLTLDEIQQLETLIELKERSAKAVANREQLEQAKNFWTDIEKTAHDTFVSIADGGKNAFQRLKETAKNTFFDWLYQQTIKKWIINIQTNGTQGALSSLTSAYGNGGGGIGGLFEAGKTLFSGFSQNLSKGLGDVFTKLGSTFGSKAATSFGSSISSSASAGGIAAAIVAGMMANNKFYDEGWRIDGQVGDIIKSQLSSMFKGNGFAPITAIMTASMASFEKILGGLGVNGKLASMLSGSAVFARAFGRKAPSIEAQGLQGTISAGGFNGNLFADILEKGGWFRSDKRYTQSQALATEQQKAFDDTIKAMAGSVRGFAEVLGLQTGAIDGYNKQIKLTFGKDEAENQKMIQEAFAGLGDDLAAAVYPALSTFQQAGETASATLQRLATGFQVVDAVLASLSSDSQTAFGAVGSASIAARERLIGLAGGVEALASQASFFAQNFLTDAERIAPIQKEVNAQLGALGLAGVTTTEQFKTAVQTLLNSGALVTEQGAKDYAQLLALAPKFKAVADYLKELNDAAEATAKAEADAAIEKARALAADRRALEIQIMDLQGDAVGALAARRSDELASVDATLRALYEHIYALEDEKAAAEAAGQALSENEGKLRDAANDALSALRDAVGAQKDVVTKAYQEAMSVLDGRIKGLNETINRTTQLSQALRGAMSGIDSPEQAVASRAAAQAQITAALAIARASGVLPSLDDLKDALSVVSKDSADQFSSFADYQRSVARTNAELEALGGLTDNQLSTAERQLRAEEAQKTLLEQSYQAEVARLDALVTAAQLELDTLNGVRTGVLSVVEGLALVRVALEGLRIGATTANPGGRSLTVEDLYRSVLGREGEAAGVAYWKNVFGDVVDSSEYLEFVKGAKRELDMNAATTYADPRSATMGSTSASADQQAINNQMAQGINRMANDINQLTRQFDSVSGGGNALATEVFA